MPARTLILVALVLVGCSKAPLKVGDELSLVSDALSNPSGDPDKGPFKYLDKGTKVRYVGPVEKHGDGAAWVEVQSGPLQGQRWAINLDVLKRSR